MQAARGAYSSRGLLSPNGAIAAEVLGRQSYMQQMLQQREQFAAGVDPLVQQQIQQRTGNAMGFSQANEALTQSNLGQSRAILTQGIAGFQQGGTAMQMGLARSNHAEFGANQGATSFVVWSGGSDADGWDTECRRFTASDSGPATATASDGRFGAAISVRDGATEFGATFRCAGQRRPYAQMGAGSNVYGLGGPRLFESSGMLQMTNQNAMAQMNATGSGEHG